jgi:hypothetical protein
MYLPAEFLKYQPAEFTKKYRPAVFIMRADNIYPINKIKRLFRRLILFTLLIYKPLRELLFASIGLTVYYYNPICKCLPNFKLFVNILLTIQLFLQLFYIPPIQHFIIIVLINPNKTHICFSFSHDILKKKKNKKG